MEKLRKSSSSIHANEVKFEKCEFKVLLSIFRFYYIHLNMCITNLIYIYSMTSLK